MKTAASLALGLALGPVSAGAIPSGIYTLEEQDCCNPLRLELTGGKEAYLDLQRKVCAGTAMEKEDGSLVVEFPDRPDFRMVLLRKEGAWVDDEGRRWLEESARPAGHEAWTPYRITVKDQDGKLLEGLKFTYQVISSKGRWTAPLVRPLESQGGVCEVLAPGDCQVTLFPQHPDLARGYGSDLVVLRAEGAAKAEVEAVRGEQISGRVVDAVTNEPVASARVMPALFTPPGFAPDRERAVKTAADGSFTLRGLASSLIYVEREDYVTGQAWVMDGEDSHAVVVKLDPGEKISGTVRDPHGKPVAGAEVADPRGKKALTGADGSFLLRGTVKSRDSGKWDLRFSKDGYASDRFQEQNPPVSGVKMELKPEPALRGEVRLLSAGGEPVRAFRVVAGSAANPDRSRWDSAEVRNADGKFSLVLNNGSRDGRCWVGVTSPDGAPWSGMVSAAELSEGLSHPIVLRAGVTLKATLSPPAGVAGPLEVRLRRFAREAGKKTVWTTAAETELELRTAKLVPGQPLVIPHLNDGDYTLTVGGPGTTAATREVKVRGSDLDLGEIKPGGTGSISGSLPVRKDEAPAERAYVEAHYTALAEETLWRGTRWENGVPFYTDAKGNFRIEGVPVGEVKITFTRALSGDVVTREDVIVGVEEGKNTTIPAGEK